MKNEELFTYQGSTPCPANIDEYWNEALKEMQGTDPRPELVESSFKVPNAECFDLYFTGVRGARIHAKYLRPKNPSSPCPAILNFHGYSGNCGQWWEKLSFVQSGFCIAAMDCRGQNGGSEDVGGVKGCTFNGHIIRGVWNSNPHDMLMRHIFLDTAMLARVIMSFEEVDESRVAAFGFSQGGALTLACAALEPRIKKLVTVYPFLCDYKKAWELETGLSAYLEIKQYFRFFDPLHEHEDEFFEKLGYIDIQNLTKRIKADTLMLTALNDVVCPPITQFAAYNKITSNKRVKFYPDYGHEAIVGADDIIYQELLTLFD